MQKMKFRHLFWQQWGCCNMVTLLAAVGFVYFSGCQSEKAVEAPEDVYSFTSEQLLRKGTEALKVHEFEWALALTDSAEKDAPESPNVPFLRARIYSELGRWEKADSAYGKTLALKPDYRGVWNNRGNNAYRQQEYKASIGLYQKELALYPSAAIPWRGMGRAYVELGMVDSALICFKKAIELDNFYSPAYLSLTFLLEDEGEFDEALNYAKEALVLEPENTEYQYVAASLMVKTGEYENALKYLYPITEKWPWHHGSHYNLGQALVRLGKEAEGKKYLDQAEKVRASHAKIEHLENTVRSLPNDPFSHAALGFALRKSGRYNDAMHAYKVALYLAPQSVEIRTNIANLCLIRGDTTQAIQNYHEILQYEPAEVNTMLNLGIVYALSGEMENAKQSWERALMFAPDHPAAKAYLARLEREAK